MADDQVRADYDRARRKAFLRDVVGFFRREPNILLSYADVRDRVTMEGESYRGMQEVPVDNIVGSVDRFRDFDRRFCPNARTPPTAGRASTAPTIRMSCSRRFSSTRSATFIS